MVSRLFREASFTVASMLRWKPTSLIQTKAPNEAVRTTQYNAVSRARIGRLKVSSKLPPNIQIRDASGSAWFALPGLPFFSTNG